ncbi:hypothetical protein HPB50_009700 [Hyalomma asiaticum]|uniref:Uncharacterized protein n=1 Tax=Hyalomma asiaticum TaxID=266040 RepID=A0ACB7THC1_HYAAI|nr:hypothetical protein HPB50_009700 [Hyalomma asiaticum]
METLFAHLNPDKCKMSRVGDAGDGEGAGSETTVTEETGSQSEMDLLKMKIWLRERELEIAREQRGSGQSSRVEGGQESRSELRYFSKLIASVLPKFPTEAEVPAWFRGCRERPGRVAKSRKSGGANHISVGRGENSIFVNAVGAAPP